MTLIPGTQLGPYKVENLIGVGGMGEVYRATDTNLKRPVALKVLPASVAGDPERLARFQREAEVLASLNHPNIASIYGLVDAGHVKGLVMELVEGDDLAARIARGPVAVDETLPITRQIAEALEAAHAVGIIHRDLKPANIKVRSDGTAKVLDFGLAKALDPGGAMPTGGAQSPTMTSPAVVTGVGVLLGTAAYVSPEQARGKPADKRSDVWAFGCVLYEMLTGRRAFAGDSVAEVMTAILARDVDWSAVPSTTPTGIQALLRRCLERDPRRRLRDIGEARVVLEDPDAWRSEVEPLPPGRRVRLLWAGIVGFALGAILTLAVFLARTSLSPQARSDPPMMQFSIPLAPARRLPATSPFRRPTDRAVSISRDGRVMVFAGEDGSGNGSSVKLYRRAIDQSLATAIAGTDGAHSGFLSPDGASVAFIGSDGTLRRVPIVGGKPTDICALDLAAFGGRIVGGSWDDEGTIVLGSHAGPLRRVAVAGGTPVDITAFQADTSDYSHRLPQHLPDGRGVLYTSIADPLGDSGRLYILPRGSKQPRELLANAADARYLPSGHLVFVRSGVLMSVRFDLVKLEVSGDAEPVVQDVMQSLGSDNPFWNSAAGQFDISQTGTLVYVPGGVYPAVVNRLLWLYRDGRTEPIGETGRSLLGPRISPSGDEIVIGQMRDSKQPLRLYDVGRQLWTSWVGVTGQVAFPIWSPDGLYVAFNWFSDSRRGVHIGRRDGSTALRQLTSGPRPRVPGDISADGRFLAFVESFTPTRSDIWVMPLDGSASPRPVVRNAGEDVQPVFTPDGQWLTYSSDVSGALEVYVEAFPGPGQPQQVSSGGGLAPVWARDGRTLYYVTHGGGMPTLMEVPMQTRPRLRPGKPRALMPFPYLVSGPARSHDIAPDGRRFVVTTYDQQEGASVTEMHVVVNWRARLK